MAAAGPSDNAVPKEQAAKASAQKVTPALQVAAELGALNAQLKLARMYAAGDGAPQNQKKAFEFYKRIVEDHTEMRPSYARENGVARAFVALGNYYRTGIPDVVRADEKRAVRLLHYAASYFGDPEAQCDLALMYLDGEGVPQNGHLAVSWLTNAAKKRHAKAQALLGDLLWHGADNVPRQSIKGLALLSLARQNAKDKPESRWIEALYAGAYSGSKADERESAAALSTRWQPKMGRADIAASEPVTQEPAPAQAAGADAAQGKEAAGFTNVGLDGAGPLR